MLKGQVLVEGVDTGAFLAALGRPGLTGALDWDGAFELRAPELALLLDSPELAGDFTLREGALWMSRKAGGRAARRPALPFERLEGQIRYKPGQLELRRLQLEAPSLSRRPLGPYRVKMSMQDGGGLRSANLRREDDRVKLLVKSPKRSRSMPVTCPDCVLPRSTVGRITRFNFADWIEVSMWSLARPAVFWITSAAGRSTFATSGVSSWMKRIGCSISDFGPISRRSCGAVLANDRHSC